MTILLFDYVLPLCITLVLCVMTFLFFDVVQEIRERNRMFQRGEDTQRAKQCDKEKKRAE